MEQAIKEILKNGYVVIDSVIDNSLINSYLEKYNKLLLANRKNKNLEKKHQRLLKIIEKDSSFLFFMFNNQLIDICEKILGNFICSSMMGNSIFPQFNNIKWHIDYPYWLIKEPFPPWREPLSLEVIYPLTDFKKENGATLTIPESHKTLKKPYNINNFKEEIKVVEAKAGDLIIAHGGWWHTSGKNVSNNTRNVILISFIKSYITPMEDLANQSKNINNLSNDEKNILGYNIWKPEKSNWRNYFN